MDRESPATKPSRISVAVQSLSRIRLFSTPWTVACQAPLSFTISQSIMIVKSLSRARLFVTPWTITYHIPLSVGFSRQEYWSGLPFPSPEDLPDPGIKPGSPAL